MSVWDAYYYQESDVTLTNISDSLPHIMAGKQLRRYGMQKLRHFHPLYSVLRRVTAELLANVNSRSRSLYAIARPSVVCNVRVPYSGGSNFRQYFYGVRYLGHPLTSTENFTEIVPGEPLRRGS